MSDISFSKLTWENLPARTTALSATNLNRIENGIADSVNGVNANAHDIAELQTRISQMSGGVPPTASSTSGMNPEVSPIYVNTTDGYWYYYDGSAWQIGGTYGGAVTSTTFNQHGVPADDFAVGEALAEKADASGVAAINTRVTAVEDDVDAVKDLIFEETVIPLTWSHGTIRNTTGAGSTSDTRIRVLDYTEIEEGARIYFDSDTKVSLRFYANNLTTNSFFCGDEAFRTSSPIDVYEASQVYEGANYFKIVYAYSNDANVSADADMAALGEKLSLVIEGGNVISELDERVSAIEEELPDISSGNVEISPTNSLLGNVSIRAAKTINFSDGTPPHIDWYLVHDLTFNFYQTKDFKTKKYLFQFVPPIGGVANWSCGIDGNNNVFFFRDAASYADSEGPRLDDAKRTNPVYFLASENYSTMHTLDFGSALKPAGWLENVGWCVLPNNDIILCEYTRGTLGTCNVWHVDGTDTTDVSNWSCTWSHAIIDTVDSDTAGMKHCHDVQYDFYTGICYFGTGDSDTGAYIYHSLDNGLTWTLTWGPDRLRCRQLNFVFTKDKVYWASDNYPVAYHYFFIGERDSNGIIDVEHATGITLGRINSQSCYGCAYIAQLGLVVMMDRNDLSDSSLKIQAYDIEAEEVVDLGTIVKAPNGGYLGFRTKYVEWYPTGNAIRIGFNSTSGAVNPDTNALAVLGNQGGTSGNGSDRINNLIMHVYKHGQTYGLRFDSEWC